MKTVKSYGDFINEGRKPKLDISVSPAEEIKSIVIKDIIKKDFEKSSNIEFEYDDDGTPISVRFEVNKADYTTCKPNSEYAATYDSVIVDAKRNFDVKLVDPMKEMIDSEGEVYILMFDIESKPKDKSKAIEKITKKIEKDMDDEDDDDDDDDYYSDDDEDGDIDEYDDKIKYGEE